MTLILTNKKTGRKIKLTFTKKKKDNRTIEYKRSVRRPIV